MITANHILVSNYKEIEQADNMNIKPPDEIHKFGKLMFNIDDVMRAWMSVNDNIVIEMYDGGEFLIKYDKGLWNKLEEHFKEER